MKKQNTMKRVILIGAIILSVFSKTYAQQYSITGKITGFKESTKFYLEDFNSQSNLDSVLIKNNSFVFKGKLDQSPTFLVVRSKGYYCNILIGNENIIIKGDAKDFPFNLKITGSKTQDIYNIGNNITKGYYEKRDSLYSIITNLGGSFDASGQIPPAQKALWKQIGVVDSLTLIARKKFIKDYINSYAGLHELFFLKSTFKKEEVQALYNSLSPQYKSNRLGQRIATYIKIGDILKKGDNFSDFTALDQYAKQNNLSDNRGKYILLDFSTTYCGPCLLSVDELKAVSKKYSDKLSVVSFSGDSKKETWMKGVTRDTPTWISLWDGKGTDSPTIMKYGVQGFPTFCLIDPNGKIITKWTGYGMGVIEANIGNLIAPK